MAELLLRWEELYERGQDTPASELAKQSPDLIPELARRINALKKVSWITNPKDPDPPITPESSLGGRDRTLGGRYRLDALVAEGGFAEVYRAYDTELHRTVAVKIPRPSHLHASHAFLAEARRVARLKHDGIVPVHDVGVEGDICFIVSEFVEGGSLADQLARRKPSKDEVLRWITEIADALEYAHLQGVVHRDIKPANILIDHHGRAKLADFGIAQSSMKTGAFAPSLGTLSYMSPEQLDGKPTDHRSDIFSLGVVIYESLTGGLPFSSREPTAVRREILEGRMPFPRPVPSPTATVVRKATNLSPHRRHQSANALAGDLRDALGRPAIPWKTLGWAMAVVAVLWAVFPPSLRTMTMGFHPPLAVSPFDATQARRHQEAWARHLGIAIETTNSIGATLVLIPPGRFLLGDKQVDTTLTKAFLIGTTAVTQEQWRHVMETEPWKGQDYTTEGSAVAATFVSWEDARSFCQRLTKRERARGTIRQNQTYRLPTEAESEFACRAGSVTEYWFGDEASHLGEYAWFGGGVQDGRPVPGGNTHSELYAHPVALKKPNPWGIFDCHGNVWTWCEDVLGEFTGPVATDPQGAAAGTNRIFKGGAWTVSAELCRSAFRFGIFPFFKSNDVGFRVVLTLSE